MNSDNVTMYKDFYLVCKIIKTPDNLNMENSKKYLQKISVASNSQKPITPQDIRANDAIQLLLRQKALNSNLPFEIAIKRPIGYEVKRFEQWRQIDNSVLAQLIFSCVCQIPGLSKSSKSRLLDDDKIYAYIFDREYDINHYFDLLMLYKKFNMYKNEQRKIINSMSEEDKTEEIINQFYICKEGIFCVLAIIYKILSMVKERKKVNTTSNYENNIEREINFVNRIFLVDDIEKISPKINDLFSFIIENISSIYNGVHLELGLSNQAYFLKNNTNYDKYIVSKFIELYKQKYSGKILREFLEEVFDLR